MRDGRLPSDIESRLSTLGDALRESPGLRFAYLFGSAAKGRLGPTSDVDIAAYFDPSADLLDGRLEALRRATRHLGTDEVDLVVLNTAPIALVARILDTRRVLHDAAPFLRQRFESRAVREACDFRIFERRLLERRRARVDPALLQRKLADLELYLSQVSEFRGIRVDRYRADWKTQRIVERTLQMAIEVCLDVANLVIADRGLRVPATYAEAFEVLAHAGLLDPTQREAMVRMTGFRNVLVHEYTDVDAAIVVRILDQHLDDLRRFGKTAQGWID